MLIHPFTLVGAVHLPPLPGAPFCTRSFQEILDKALVDADTLLTAGFNGLIIENFGDAPFFPDQVEPHTISLMTVIAREVTNLVTRRNPRRERVLVGINVLRNDAKAGLAVAFAAGADFIRVNVHVGAMATDQGILEGKAYETLRYRKQIGAETFIVADVFVKHAVPVGPADLAGAARDTWERGRADALVVSGSSTGLPPSVQDIVTVKRAVPRAPVLVGSGLDLDNLPAFVPVCEGAIVGTSIKRDGVVTNPVDPDRAAALVRARDRLASRAAQRSEETPR